MSPKTILVREDSRELSKHDALLESELKINNASRETVESIRTIGRELIRIEEDELWEVMGRANFKEYVEIRLQMDYGMARRMMTATLAMDLLKEKKLELPANASQVVELAKLRVPSTLISVWNKITDYSHQEKVPITFSMVRDAVTAQRAATGQYLTRARVKQVKVVPGIKVDLNIPAPNNGEPAAATIQLSEEGEKALNRIKRLCGAATYNAIANQTVKIAEKDLLYWAEQEAEMVKNLGYWITIKRWSLRKSMAYEKQSIDAETTVADLGDLAMSRGGHLYVECGEIHITIDIMRET